MPYLILALVIIIVVGSIILSEYRKIKKMKSWKVGDKLSFSPSVGYNGRHGEEVGDNTPHDVTRIRTYAISFHKNKNLNHCHVKLVKWSNKQIEIEYEDGNKDFCKMSHENITNITYDERIRDNKMNNFMKNNGGSDGRKR